MTIADMSVQSSRPGLFTMAKRQMHRRAMKSPASPVTMQTTLMACSPRSGIADDVVLWDDIGNARLDSESWGRSHS
jgi:hypothetical protein